MAADSRILALLFALPLLAPSGTAQERKILSPRDSVILTIDTCTIAVNYSRPSMRGRRIMGDLVPWNKVWRTGANQATHLRTSGDIHLGGMPVPAGNYTLWTIPSPSAWAIILNKQTGQWGTQYDERLDLARFTVAGRRVAAVCDTFTIGLRKTGTRSGALTLQWEHTAVEIPFRRAGTLGALSPLDSASIRLGGKRMLIRYSRPWMRGRTVWGVVVPWDTVWRTGANLATALVVDADVSVGGARIPRGSYTLYSLPSPDAFTLIVSTTPGGSPPQYDASRDLARIPMRLRKPQRPIDPFRIWLEPRGARKATIHLGWADRVYSTELTLP